MAGSRANEAELRRALVAVCQRLDAKNLIGGGNPATVSATAESGCACTMAPTSGRAR